MASTTSTLGLTKPAYSETADVNVINTNMDLIDTESGKVRGNFADAYDSTASYAVGDWCLYEGVLYRCTTAIASGGEAWNSNHWSHDEITEYLATLNSKIATGTFTPYSLSELESKILEYANDMANGSMRSIAIYCGFNSAPFVNTVVYTGTISKYNSGNLSVSLVSTTGVDVEMGYGNNTWTITSLNSNLKKLDSEQNYTNDILASAISATGSCMFSGNGSSYTGNIPDANLKYGTFFVLVRGTRKFVTGYSSTGDIYTNTYNGSAWAGWEQLALNSKLIWKLLAEKSDTSAINYPSDWNELWVIASGSSDGYGWDTVSLIIPKAFPVGEYISATGRNNIVLVVYRGVSGISVEGTASQNVVKWKAYYR